MKRGRIIVRFTACGISVALLLSDPAAASAYSSLQTSFASSRLLTPRTIRVPPRYGSVVDRWTGDGGHFSMPSSPFPLPSTPFVVLIQDLHANYVVQKNMARIIDFLERKYGVRRVFLEGADGGFDTSLFTDIANPTARHRVADALLKEAY